VIIIIYYLIVLKPPKVLRARTNISYIAFYFDSLYVDSTMYIWRSKHCFRVPVILFVFNLNRYNAVVIIEHIFIVPPTTLLAIEYVCCALFDCNHKWIFIICSFHVNWFVVNDNSLRAQLCFSYCQISFHVHTWYGWCSLGVLVLF